MNLLYQPVIPRNLRICLAELGWGNSWIDCIFASPVRMHPPPSQSAAGITLSIGIAQAERHGVPGTVNAGFPLLLVSRGICQKALSQLRKCNTFPVVGLTDPQNVVVDTHL